jgi:hypothetical protein
MGQDRLGAGCREHGSEPWGSVDGKEFPDGPSPSQLLNILLGRVSEIFSGTK